ncbi:MAG TPA: biopolymer transporter ExbD [Gemmatimonadales bacterium]|nr:biopolymer transporter ExbD [Gemmatimonadales bacterium]
MALSVSKDGGSSVKADINVTPMIDVMLVLLIIFMIVTPAIAAGFQAQIPRASHAAKRPEDNGEIRLGIDKNGKFFLDMVDQSGTYTGMKPVPDDATLQNILNNVYAGRSSDKILFLKSDANVPFSRIQQAIEIGRKAGVRVIDAIAEQTRGLKPEDENN